MTLVLMLPYSAAATGIGSVKRSRFCQFVLVYWLLDSTSLADVPRNVNEYQHQSGILSDVLFTFVSGACDGDAVRLRCPRATTIDPLEAEYGSSSPGRPGSNGLCTTPESLDVRSTIIGSRETETDTETEVPATRQSGRLPCSNVSDSFQVVKELCQDKQQCRVNVVRQLFARGAECPSTGGATYSFGSNWLSVTYQCRPFEFRSRSACIGQSVELSCPRDQRIAVNSASYSPLVGAGPCVTSLSRDAADGQLTSTYRTHAAGSGCDDHRLQRRLQRCDAVSVGRLCHSRESCTVVADNELLHGLACLPAARTLSALRVVYACVQARVLMQSAADRLNAESAICRSAAALLHNDEAINEEFENPRVSSRNNNSIGSFDTVTTSSKFVNSVEVDDVYSSAAKRSGHSFIVELTWLLKFFQENRERASLYAALGVLTGISLFLLLTVGYLARSYIFGHRIRMDKTSDRKPEELEKLEKSQLSPSTIGSLSTSNAQMTIASVSGPCCADHAGLPAGCNMELGFPAGRAVGTGSDVSMIAGVGSAYSNQYRGDCDCEFEQSRLLLAPVRLQFDDD